MGSSNGADGENNRGFDVAIVGGGPAGSTCGTILRKYNPSLRVVILEKEKFPRDHVGESQLPGISAILDEMGVWDKIESAGFPIKIGASYTWGRSADQWDFDFYPAEKFVDEPRPARFDGQRRFTAFQVDRALYDDILLRHAELMGCAVLEETSVREVLRDGDRINGLRLDNGDTITAKHYVDATGVVGLIKRAMGVTSWEPEELRNIAIWDYWENAEWAVEIGVGATRVQVRSLPYGWIWFIPLGPTRTSIGLITPSEHYRKLNISPEALYEKALEEQADIRKLVMNATRTGQVQSCKDWSHVADRLVGENWIIAGEAAGFADPILAAGMMLAHNSARDAAYTILELERGEQDARWLRRRYNDRHRHNITQHVRFAQFWYSANGCFTDLKEHCQQIAREAGLKLSPAQAWRWLSQGGFAHQNPAHAAFGSFDVETAKATIEQCLTQDGEFDVHFAIDDYNLFRLNVKGARTDFLGELGNGRITPQPCYRRGEHVLPQVGYYRIIIDALEKSAFIGDIVQHFMEAAKRIGIPPDMHRWFAYSCLQTLEAMVTDGWIFVEKDPNKPMLQRQSPKNIIRSSAKGRDAVTQHAAGTIKFNI